MLHNRHSISVHISDSNTQVLFSLRMYNDLERLYTAHLYNVDHSGMFRELCQMCSKALNQRYGQLHSMPAQQEVNGSCINRHLGAPVPLCMRY